MSFLRLFITTLAFFVTSSAFSGQAVSDKEVAGMLNVRMGIELMTKGDAAEAKKKFTASIKLAPENPSSWYGMAYYFEATGKSNEAEHYYERAVNVAPDSGEAHNNYGTYLCRKGEYKKAIEQFLKATNLQTYADISSAYENAGICALELPNQSQAAGYFVKALENNPKQTVSLLQLAKINHAEGKKQAARGYLAQFNSLSAPSIESKKLAHQLSR